MDSDTQASMLPCPLSDHSIIQLKIGASPAGRGPGLWRLNNALLLREDYSALIRETIDRAVSETSLSNPNSKWEWIKFSIKSASVKFAKDLRSQAVVHERDLREGYTKLSNRMDSGSEIDVEEMRSIEREIREIELHKTNIANKQTTNKLGSIRRKAHKILP